MREKEPFPPEATSYPFPSCPNGWPISLPPCSFQYLKSAFHRYFLPSNSFLEKMAPKYFSPQGSQQHLFTYSNFSASLRSKFFQNTKKTLTVFHRMKDNAHHISPMHFSSVTAPCSTTMTAASKQSLGRLVPNTFSFTTIISVVFLAATHFHLYVAQI